MINNIPYMPEYNGIEVLFGKMKYLFRQKLTNHKLKDELFDVK